MKITKPRIAGLIVAPLLGVGLLSATAFAATPASTSHPATSTAVTPPAASTADAADATGKPDVSETAGNEQANSGADGPGGHADPAGANVDHQFNGVE